MKRGLYLTVVLALSAAVPSWAAEVPLAVSPEGKKLNRLIRIEGGEFLMGFSEDVNLPQHRVRVSSFYLQEHEVTNEEYRRFKPDHEFPQGEEKHPVVYVSWDDASAYAEWLGGRLPTEAEWEYACRAGTETLYWSGDSEKDLAKVGWYGANSGGMTHPVGQKPANPWGLYDMHGNVWEWVADWHDRGLYGRRAAGQESGEAVQDPRGPSRGGVRVIRGGSFRDSALYALSGLRNYWVPKLRKDDLGFRVAFPAAPSERK